MKLNSIYNTFEQEFGRSLSPMEKEFINEWKENSISEESIVLALKESIFNGVRSFRYIDKILQTWNKEESKTQSETEATSLDDDDAWLN